MVESEDLGRDLYQPQGFQSVLADGPSCVGHDSASPKGLAEPVADFGPMGLAIDGRNQADSAEKLIGRISNGPVGRQPVLSRFFCVAGEPFFEIAAAVGRGDSQGVAIDFAIVEQADHGLFVRRAKLEKSESVASVEGHGRGIWVLNGEESRSAEAGDKRELRKVRDGVIRAGCLDFT